jgi:hypothetical protein
MIEPEKLTTSKLIRFGTFSIPLFFLIFVIGIFRIEAAEVESFYPYITASLPISGYVRQLIIPEKTPNFLFALVGFDGKRKPSDKPGLYVFDVSDPTKIKQIQYLPIVSPIGIELGPDGHTLFLYSYNESQSPDGWHGVLALDISNPHDTREAGRLNIDIVQARLSFDGALLFV